MDYTLIKISRIRRNELEQVWLEMQIKEGKRMNLQEVVDQVLDIGIHAFETTPSAGPLPQH